MRKVVIIFLFASIFALFSYCQPKNNNSIESMKKHTNALINESSPYLLQHAHNPVNWFPWGNKALNKAKEENKPLLISVGYAACHWCHVMEKESFEDEGIAEIMNNNFVCIKVDREERPDIDQIYMDAVQLMTGRGGWPLNCFALPNGKPFYGGTYFNPEQWTEVLSKIAEAYKNSPEQVVEYADKLTEGIQQLDLVTLKDSANKQTLEKILTKGVDSWSSYFDLEDGGNKNPPKFPMPTNYNFLMHYTHLFPSNTIEEHLQRTLDNMALKGLFDQVGGGFYRYSVDGYWKIPHFEKMLYDNGQLIKLYSEAYKKFGDDTYKEVVFKTYDFLKRDLQHDNGIFFSSLDADSEGVEGKFYVWEMDEIQKLLSADEYQQFEKCFYTDKTAYWEDGNYVLMRKGSYENCAILANTNQEQLKTTIENVLQKLLTVRENRIKPGLDDKVLCAWNALTISGFISAYQAFGKTEFLATAEKNFKFILTEMRREDGGLWRNWKNNNANINAYLEDYAAVIAAGIQLYQVTGNTYYLQESKQLMDYTLDHFLDEQSTFFYYTSDVDEALVARKKELSDNVIPSSNAMMAKNLLLLGEIYQNDYYLKVQERMLGSIIDKFADYATAYTDWASLALLHLKPFYEVAIVGNDAENLSKELMQHFLPNAIVLWSDKNDSLPLLKGKFQNEKTLFYVCVEKACQKPVQHTAEALKQIYE